MLPFCFASLPLSVSTRWAASKGQGVENWQTEPARHSRTLPPLTMKGKTRGICRRKNTAQSRWDFGGLSACLCQLSTAGRLIETDGRILPLFFPSVKGAFQPTTAAGQTAVWKRRKFYKTFIWIHGNFPTTYVIVQSSTSRIKPSIESKTSASFSITLSIS